MENVSVFEAEVDLPVHVADTSEAELRESACKAHFSIYIEEEVFEDELVQFVGYIKQYAT